MSIGQQTTAPRGALTREKAGAQAAAPKTSEAGRTPEDRHIFGSLRAIRAAAQYLEDLLAKPPSCNHPAVPGADPLAGAADLAEVDRIISGNLDDIQYLLRASTAELEWCADSVTLITLLWHRNLRLCQHVSADAVERAADLAEVAAGLDQIVYQCAALTLTPRVNDVMCNLRVGQALNLEFQFGDELPRSPQLRKRVLDELAQQAAAIEGGLVDVDQGIVYRAARSRAAQIFSSVQLVAVLLLGTLIPVLLAYASRFVHNWRFSSADLQRLLADYVFILLGSGAHIAIALLKAVKNDTRPNFKTIDDWMLWLHVREAQVLQGFAYIWMGYLLLVFTVSDLEWSTAFFAGYSIDSVTELFLERFETLALTRQKALIPK